MTCPTGKRAYSSRADARAMRRRYPGAPRRAYLCEQCRSWHLGRLTRAAKNGQHQGSTP